MSYPNRKLPARSAPPPTTSSDVSNTSTYTVRSASRFSPPPHGRMATNDEEEGPTGRISSAVGRAGSSALVFSCSQLSDLHSSRAQFRDDKPSFRHLVSSYFLPHHRVVDFARRRKRPISGYPLADRLQSGARMRLPRVYLPFGAARSDCFRPVLFPRCRLRELRLWGYLPSSGSIFPLFGMIAHVDPAQIR